MIGVYRRTRHRRASRPLWRRSLLRGKQPLEFTCSAAKFFDYCAERCAASVHFVDALANRQRGGDTLSLVHRRRDTTNAQSLTLDFPTVAQYCLNLREYIKELDV